jgi:hypothetical protein
VIYDYSLCFAAVADSRIWVLDRRVFQAIMMKTGLQRQEENIRFLKWLVHLRRLNSPLVTQGYTQHHPSAKNQMSIMKQLNRCQEPQKSKAVLHGSCMELC